MEALFIILGIIFGLPFCIMCIVFMINGDAPTDYPDNLYGSDCSRQVKGKDDLP